MPHTFSQWCWFIFFFGGGAGGWIVLAVLGYDIARGYRKAAGK